jgi:hypothetical protein
MGTEPVDSICATPNLHHTKSVSPVVRSKRVAGTGVRRYSETRNCR